MKCMGNRLDPNYCNNSTGFITKCRYITGTGSLRLQPVLFVESFLKHYYLVVSPVGVLSGRLLRG
jgi:hypothetical protein